MAKTNITPKQAQIKLASLLKGIDNSTVALNKHQENISKNAKEISALVTGLAVQPVVKAEKPVKTEKTAKAKPEKAVAKPAKAEKPAKAVTKSAKVAKADKMAKADKPVKAEKEVKTIKVAKKSFPPPVEGRPTLKEAIKEVMQSEGKPLPASDVWNKATAKYGYWSRQSCYNALDDDKTFEKTDSGFSLKPANGVHNEVDSFVDAIERPMPAAAVSTVQ